MKQGSYFGTEIAGRWWKRYREQPFFARGNGEFDLNATGVSFRKKLTREPVVISWGDISSAGLGKWHAGRWAMGHPILKIEFIRDGQNLCAGFLLSRDWTAMETLASDITQRARQASS